MKIYRIPRDNDFYIGISMKMVSASGEEEPVDVRKIGDLKVTLRNPYANTITLECAAMEDDMNTLVAALDTSKMVCGNYSLDMEGIFGARKAKNVDPAIIEITHEMLPGNVEYTEYKGERLFFVDTQKFVFGNIYLRFTDIVNNLEDGGAEAVLSAEMGKQLKLEIEEKDIDISLSEYNKLVEEDSVDPTKNYYIYEEE